RAAALVRDADQMQVLVRNAVARIDHRDDGARVLDGLKALHDAEFLDGLADARAAANAGRVDQQKLLAAALARHEHAVARRAGLGRRDEPVAADEAVDQRRLADVRPADDGDLRQARLARRTDALGTLGALGTRAAGPLARRTFDAFGAVGVFETFTVFAILTALSARGAFDDRRRTLTVVDVALRRERREHALEQRRHALPVQRGDALRLAQAELVKLGL